LLAVLFGSKSQAVYCQFGGWGWAPKTIQTKFIFCKKKTKRNLSYLQVFGSFVGFWNLTALSVVHAIPRLVTGTVWLPLNDKVKVSNSKKKKESFE